MAIELVNVKTLEPIEVAEDTVEKAIFTTSGGDVRYGLRSTDIAAKADLIIFLDKDIWQHLPDDASHGKSIIELEHTLFERLPLKTLDDRDIGTLSSVLGRELELEVEAEARLPGDIDVG